MRPKELHSSTGETYHAAVTRTGEPLGRGKEGEVRAVVMAIDHPEGVEIGHMAEKTFHVEPPEDDRALAKQEKKITEKIRRTMEMHRILLEKQYPTIPHLLTDDEKKLYMTDLSLGGKKEVYSTPDFERQLPAEKVVIANRDGLNLFLEGLLKKSIEDGLYIKKKDVFFLTVDRATRQAECLFGDLTQLEFLPPNDAGQIDIRSHNAIILKKFVRKMNEVLSPDCQLTPPQISG